MNGLTIPQVANMVGVSRQAIYKKVVSGKLPATKIGRNYIIADAQIDYILGHRLSAKDKTFNKKAVDIVFNRYGSLLRRLAAV